MSFPYISDLINYGFGTHLHIPVAMFGLLVTVAIFTATQVATKEVKRFEALGILPQARIAPHVLVPAHVLVAKIAMITTVYGLIGARIFHILEYPAEFVDNPLGMIFTRAGFSIYGGLIVGGIAGIFFLKKWALPVVPMLDALAPSIALGYGIGRMGCQLSGDGDWGIASNLLLKPHFIPTWFWAQTYENNIAGVVIQSPGVYPTPIYESIIAFLIFAFLWTIRKQSYFPGFIFSLYLLMSGFARLLIEKIRINAQYHFLGFSFTQAEFISTVLIAFGLFGLLKVARIKFSMKLSLSLIVVCALAACSRL